jgi:hypothetical protein
VLRIRLPRMRALGVSCLHAICVIRPPEGDARGGRPRGGPVDARRRVLRQVGRVACTWRGRRRRARGVPRRHHVVVHLAAPLARLRTWAVRCRDRVCVIRASPSLASGLRRTRAGARFVIRSSGSRNGCPQFLARPGTRARRIPRTENPPMCAKNATPPPFALRPGRARPRRRAPQSGPFGAPGFPTNPAGAALARASATPTGTSRPSPLAVALAPNRGHLTGRRHVHPAEVERPKAQR